MPDTPAPKPQTPAPQVFPVVALGASAGGLEACERLFRAVPSPTGAAFILVQYLDPSHESLLTELLAERTTLTVEQAADGRRLEPEHLYIIPPGTYLSVSGGVLHLTKPQSHRGARLPFDVLLHSLAADCGGRAICVVLSGTGSDGSLGLRSIKDRGGRVIAQDPEEADYAGMPRSAIMTGDVDDVLLAADIPAMIARYAALPMRAPRLPDPEQDGFHDIIALVRSKTSHDFTLYKPGTLQRRIERRMAMSSLKPNDMRRYLEFLNTHPEELEGLAKDLLINVTNFFRDAKAYDLLAATVAPELVAKQPPDQPLRIWIAGCSSGEEPYSIAMVFLEAIAEAKRNIKLQVFASDVDSDAIAAARAGVYPQMIETEVSAARLARFFSKEGPTYRVIPDLRATVVFTVQDVLLDPPFSKLDLISCRNLLIYLNVEAQAKILSIFHFALRPGGVLFLGGSETAGNIEGRFQTISKPERLYRRIGRNRPEDIAFARLSTDGSRAPNRPPGPVAPLPQTALAEFCRQAVMQRYAPAVVLINAAHDLLYALGKVDLYLTAPEGQPTQDLLAMTPPSLRAKLRSAIKTAGEDNARIVIEAARTAAGGVLTAFRIEIEPVIRDQETLFLIGFHDVAKPAHPAHAQVSPEDAGRIAELERELETVRTDLKDAIHNLEKSSEEQKAINEEALSVAEEYQSTNEELLTSKEELQSLNEELTALNSQLQETLERSRTTSNDLENVLFSTDVATLFLDTKLNIRLFTPATQALFSIIATDVGQPISDFRSALVDSALLSDARLVLKTLSPIDREIEAEDGVCYLRRILPYRVRDDSVEGVVMTFANITERKRAGKALEAAMRQARLANIAKSRFLAAASHDLRQPLQTLALLQGLLAKTVTDSAVQKLVARLDETVTVMSGMLNTLLDINQIEAGTVKVEPVCFPVNDLLGPLSAEFAYHAQAKGLGWRQAPCSLRIDSDPRLLEQMVRNLLSNALKYTPKGKILFGCRRRKDILCIEIWDTGIGIESGELQTIFEEYHQLDNAARERSRGLGLGLSIVQRLSELLGHKVTVRSELGKGSVFAIEVKLDTGATKAPPPPPQGPPEAPAKPYGALMPAQSILLIEDDPELRHLLGLLLEGEGYVATAAADGLGAIALAAGAPHRPDLILADFNLPNGLDGLQVVDKLRTQFQYQIPAIILTGDISTGALSKIADKRCVRLSKPVNASELTQVIAGALRENAKAEKHPGLAAVRTVAAHPLSPSPEPRHSLAAAASAEHTVFVVDDDRQIRDSLRDLLAADGHAVETFESGEALLEAHARIGSGCLLIDAYLPGMKGLELLQQLKDRGDTLPAIMITGSSDVPMAVQAMKAGVLDFIEKPILADELLAAVARGVELSRDSGKAAVWRQAAVDKLAALTDRQREILTRVLSGQPSKNIAVDLGISQRTVENHRASIMKKTGTRSLPALARLAVAVSGGQVDE